MKYLYSILIIALLLTGCASNPERIKRGGNKPTEQPTVTSSETGSNKQPNVTSSTTAKISQEQINTLDALSKTLNDLDTLDRELNDLDSATVAE